MPKFTAERIGRIRDHLRELDQRSVSVAAFAREIGVTPVTIRNWRRRFGQRPTESASGLTEHRADLLEVQQGALLTSTPIEIECAGMLIRVSHSIDEDLLRAVLRAVKSC